jgi:hypothetical protein
MVAALLSDLGVSMGPQSADGMQRDGLLGGEATGIFYVEDAATTVDARARKIIPAQDFVAAYGVKTVFGMGGAWANGEAVACIVFGRKFLARNVARRVAPLLSVFRAATNTLAVSGRHFEEQR